MDLTAVIKKGDKQFVALCPELDLVSQDYSIEEALDNLKEASDLFIETMGKPVLFRPVRQKGNHIIFVMKLFLTFNPHVNRTIFILIFQFKQFWICLNKLR